MSTQAQKTQKNPLILDYIDEQRHQQICTSEKRIYSETLRDESQINFADLLERQWSVSDQQQSEKFFHSKQIIPQEVYSEILNGGEDQLNIKSRVKVIADNGLRVKKQKMRSVFTIFDSPQHIEDIEMYLTSEMFRLFIRLIVVMNLVGLFLVEYSFRVETKKSSQQSYTASSQQSMSIANVLALHLQLYANCVFTLQILLQFFSTTRFNISNPWIVLNLVGTIACWATIFLDTAQYDDNSIYRVVIIVKILRGLRIIEVFQCLKNPFEVFIATVPSLNKIFFPLLVFMSFYAIIGQSLFIGANESRCRVTPTPEQNVSGQWQWISVDDNSLCGSSAWQCPEGYCGNPYDYGMPYNQTQQFNESKEYGLVGFDNFLKSMLTVYHYVFLSNWTGIIFKFSKYINPYLTSFYFVSMAVVLFFILANLIFISLSKAYIEKEKLLEKSKANGNGNGGGSGSGNMSGESQNTDDQNNNNNIKKQPLYTLQKQPNRRLIRNINFIEAGVILFQCVIIVWDYQGMAMVTKHRVDEMDFIVNVIAIGLILAQAYLSKLRMFRYNCLNFLDLVLLLAFMADICYCLVQEHSIIYVESDLSAVLRSVKFLRIIKNLYVSENILKYERNIVNLFFQTLSNMRYFLLLLICIMLIFSFIGEMLFAYRVRFNSFKEIDLQNGEPYVSNYESWYKSIVSIVLLFENERWTETMYNYYYVVGMWALVFYAMVAFFVHLMLTRLFMAVFLCYFRRDLERNNKAMMKGKNGGDTNCESSGNCFIKDDKENHQLSESEAQGSNNGSSDGSEQQNQINNNNNKNNIRSKTVIGENLQYQLYENSSSKEGTSSIQQKKSSSMSSQQIGGYGMGGLKKSIKMKNSKYLFWIVPKNNCFLQLIKLFYNSKIFSYFTFIAILLHAVTIIFRSNNDTQEKTHILDSIQNISIFLYCFEVFLGVMSYGVYFQKDGYLCQNSFNVLNFIVAMLTMCSILPFIDPLNQLIIKRMTVIKIFTVLKSKSKETDIILEAIAKIFKNFMRIVFIYAFFLFMAALLPLKLLKNSLYNCYDPYLFDDVSPNNLVDCINAGGDWVEDSQNFNNIFNAVTLMYQIVASESWTYFIELTIRKNPYWDIFFVTVFFFYNVCLLNIFVGLTVETYLDLKDKAYHLNLLRPSQRGWILIKNCINQLVPEPIVECESFRGFFHEIAYKIISDQNYNNIIDILAYVNMLLYAVTVYRSDEEILMVLAFSKGVILFVFSIDTLLKLYALKSQYFYLQNSRLQLIGLVYTFVYAVCMVVFKLTNEEERILEFFLVILLFLRCKKFLFRFTWSKTLINSVIEILPKCIQIGTFLLIVLFVYVAVGLQLFKHVKPTEKSDGYTTGFQNFFSGLITLLKIASNESWFDQVTVFVRGSQSTDICYSINSQEQADKYSGMGCGTLLAYPFFLTYHMTMALLIFNLLIATMISAYDENYEKQYNSVNVFQLQDCLELWKKYDPKGKGVIPYKKFWRLSSQIGILFGISKKKLIKSKQKFLEQLDIPICQSISPQDEAVLCYRFHDVITKFSKIKLQVSLDKGDDHSNSFEFDIHPIIENEIRDFTTKIPEELYRNYRQFKNYTSGEMKYLFGLLRKLRSWKTHSKSKGEIKVSKLSRIIKVAMEKKVQEENLKNLLAFCTGDGKDLKRKKSYPSKMNISQSHVESSREVYGGNDEASHEESDDEMVPQELKAQENMELSGNGNSSSEEEEIHDQ